MSLASLVSGPVRVPLSRRRMLVLAALAPAAGAALTACGPGTGDDGPDPLIELARRARIDAGLAAAAVAAVPALAPRLDPVRAARTDHAGALDAEVARLDPTAVAAPPPPPGPTTTSLTEVRDALRDSASAATQLVMTLPAQRVGLVAAVAACCAAYVEVLT